MTTSAAQDEFNELLRDKDIENRHPEDRHLDSDHSDPDSAAHDEDFTEIINTDDELDVPLEMRDYTVPTRVTGFNTGVKGVIADAQNYERARSESKRLETKPKWKKNSNDSDDDSYMHEWRAQRYRELQRAYKKIKSRAISPAEVEDPPNLVEPTTRDEFFRPIRTAARDDVVVALIRPKNLDDVPQDDRDETIAMIERAQSAMKQVARCNGTVVFSDVCNSVVDMTEHDVCLPSVQAYRNGKVFKVLLPFRYEFPSDSEISAKSFETVLRRHGIL